MPLRVYTADHVLIGEFGEERRSIVRFQDIPDQMKKAVLAIEDDRFYEHGGVDFVGHPARGHCRDLTHGGASQGASTITMQVARNFFLSSEKTYTRKIYEMLLAYKIERALTKDQILEVYMNQIYLGERAYGFAAAARVYFGKDLKDITLAEAAMLAGLPKAPSAYNPVVNPKRAKIRQEYILKRMLELQYISQDQYDEAVKEDDSHQEPGQRVQRARRVRRRNGAPDDVRAVQGRDLHARPERHHHDRFRRPGRRLPRGAQGRDGLRAAPRLSRPGSFIELPAPSDDREQAIDDALTDHPDNGEIIAAVVTDGESEAGAGATASTAPT